MTREIQTVTDQVTRFGVALERMNRQIARDRNRKRLRVLALILAFLAGVALCWIVKDAPAKIAATVLQAEAMPESW